jgi:hypothetical protein
MYIGRIILTIGVMFIGLASSLYSLGETLLLSNVAGHQFDNSDVSYLVASGIPSGAWLLRSIFALATVLVLLGIWLKPLRRLIAWTTTMAITAGTLLVGADVRPALAYYDKQDWAEVVLVLPNESAFWIPDVGDNKSSQTALDSEAYLTANKVQTKRFTIPHAQIPGSGWFSGFYGPTGRLILVDRTPYQREWTRSGNRGTSQKDESFPCQSKEGLNVIGEINIAASVTDQNAPKFLYYFGVKPPAGDRNDSKVIFTSVFYGRSLAEVMDTVVRGEVSTLFCSEVAKRPLVKVNDELNDIMSATRQGAADFMATRGVTLDFLGLASTLTFDGDVQAAINRAFDATQDRKVAEILQPYQQTLLTLSVADAIRTAVAKFDGHMPQTLSGLWLFPSNWIENIAGTFKAAAETKSAAPTAK